MLHHLPSDGGNGKHRPSFPLTIDIKVIIEKLHPEEFSAAYLRTIFSQLKIPNTNWRSKLSSEGRYISYTIEIILSSDELMKKLYSELGTIPGIKLAL